MDRGEDPYQPEASGRRETLSRLERKGVLLLLRRTTPIGIFYFLGRAERSEDVIVRSDDLYEDVLVVLVLR